MRTSNATINNQYGFDADVAFRFGKEDAEAGKNIITGLDFYPVTSPMWPVYRAGYYAGLHSYAQLRVNWNSEAQP